jgi:hypothetical protein
VPSHGNTFDFYETPRLVQTKECPASDEHIFENDPLDGCVCAHEKQNDPPEDIEINNTNRLPNTETYIGSSLQGKHKKEFVF